MALRVRADHPGEEPDEAAQRSAERDMPEREPHPPTDGADPGTPPVSADALPEAVLQDGEPPAIFVDSAEGATTYPGFNGDARSENARKWVEQRLIEQAKRYGGDSGEDD